MQTTSMLVLRYCVNRCFNTSCINYKQETLRQSKFLKKMLTGNRPKSKLHKQGNDEPISFLSSKSAQTTRRMTVLNKLFMEHITDFIAAGEVADYLPGGDIEISHVKIAPDFKIVNVFWVDSNINDSAQMGRIDEMLQECAKYIRHELSQLRIIGVVPPIQFVRNKFINIELKVDERLKVADFGEHHVPPIYPWDEKKVIKYNDLESKTNCDVKTGATENLDNVCYMTLPAMRNDVLGLDHHKIMSKIKISVEKARKSSTKSALKHVSRLDACHNTNTSSCADTMTERQQRELFTKFLNKRQMELKRKKRRKENNQALYNVDLEEFNMDDSCTYDDLDVYDDNYNDYEDNV